MEMVSICQEMGWTYQEYIGQPMWFINLLKDKLQIDSRNMRKEISKIKRK